MNYIGAIVGCGLAAVVGWKGEPALGWVLGSGVALLLYSIAVYIERR